MKSISDNTAEQLGIMIDELISHPHNTFTINHNRSLGFDTSIWTVTVNNTVYSDLDFHKAIKKAHQALVLSKKS